MTKAKKYTGSAYIGVVGAEMETGVCRDSIQGIITRPGDGMFQMARGTKGYESRQKHINNFIDSGHDFCMMLDADMVFAPDTLERLRSHGVPYVSGLYMRRQIDPMGTVWFHPFKSWPFDPWVTEPERGRLHELGASGWGCLLIHRDVVLAVRELLKGEWEVLEDDMDVYPYDLTAILGAVAGLRRSLTLDVAPARMREILAEQIAVLEREIRPLRRRNDTVGSDIRFPFYAAKAGYKLVGDPDVRPGHVINYALSPDDQAGLRGIFEAMEINVINARKSHMKAGAK